MIRSLLFSLKTDTWEPEKKGLTLPQEILSMLAAKATIENNRFLAAENRCPTHILSYPANR